MQWFLNILVSLDYYYTFFQLECIATPIPWNVIIDIVGRRGKRNVIRPPFVFLLHRRGPPFFNWALTQADQ